MADDETQDNQPINPYGDDPVGIPDPMPDELRDGAAEEKSRIDEGDADPIDGPAPSG